MKALELIGKRFGSLTVLSKTVNAEGGHSRWNCRCDCGAEKLATGYKLNAGLVISCGCARLPQLLKKLTIHGQAKVGKRSGEYICWNNMIQRCTNPNNKQFGDYGGRGIQVCERWKRFANFLADMGTRPSKLTIERKNNNLGYEPGNCVWDTRGNQNRNQRPRRKKAA